MKKMNGGKRSVLILMLVLMLSLSLLAGCRRIGGSIDPGEWGYDCVVVYNALGGVINTREVRETYYMKGSLLFRPAGTTNMLIKPVKDGYILAGWYLDAKEAGVDKNGETIYEFDAQDRWDFNVDRVEESITLYARWVKKGTVEYVDSMTGEVMFSKNITASSPVQPLTQAIRRLIEKPGYTMDGYFADREATTPYDFSGYVHGELVPTEREVYEKLALEFPDAIAVYEGEEEQPLIEDELTAEEEAAQDIPEEEIVPGEDEEAEIPVDQAPIDPYAYIKRLGYIYTTEDEAVLDAIKVRKNEIIEESIQYYIDNTSERTVWLHYTEGASFVVNSIDDLKLDGRYGFFGVDSRGQRFDKYVIKADLDFKGKALDMVSEFSGTIEGNGHTIDNAVITIAGRRRDLNMHMTGALFGKLNGATISDLTFKNFTINVSLSSTNSLSAAPIALEAEKSTLKNITIERLEYNLGRGDDGKADYIISDFILEQGDSVLENIKVNELLVESKYADVRKDFAK
jgi:hypothetical protein